MRHVIYHVVVITGSIFAVSGVEWKKPVEKIGQMGITLKEKTEELKNPVETIKNVGITLKNKAEELKNAGETLAKVGIALKDNVEALKNPGDTIGQVGITLKDKFDALKNPGETIGKVGIALKDKVEALKNPGETIGKVGIALKDKVEALKNPGETIGKIGIALKDKVDALKNPGETIAKVGIALKDNEEALKNPDETIGKVGIALKDKPEELKHPVETMEEIGTTLKEKTVNILNHVNRQVETADFRLMHKDPAKTAQSHPLLPAADVDVDQATLLFETGWSEYYKWTSGLNSEYEPVHTAYNLFNNEHYNDSLDTLILLHDRCGSAKDPNIMMVLEALKLRNFDVHFNIMEMDFNKFMCNTVSPKTGISKIGFSPQLQVLATEIGRFILIGKTKGNIKIRQVNFISLGISTHLAALAAKHIKGLSGEKINSILGLDPPVRLRRTLIDKDSAESIHIYHTFKFLPLSEPVTGRATADFVFGGGKRGPQCKTSITTNCFKEFGVKLFISTLLFPKLFPARWCPSYAKFSEHFCESNDYAYVSFPPDKSATGTYEMDINYVFPYGKGFDGIYQEPEVESEDSEGSEEIAKLSQTEYLHRMEEEVNRIRSDIISCMGKKLTPGRAQKCIMLTRPAVNRMVKDKLIRRIRCENWEESPTGKKCTYETRTKNTFFLPF